MPAPGPRLALLIYPQRAAHRIPELAAAFLILRRRSFDLTQLLEQLPLLGGELVRRPDVDPHVEIAVPAFAQTRQPFGAQPIRHVGLRSRLEPPPRLAELRWHPDFDAELRP